MRSNIEDLLKFLVTDESRAVDYDGGLFSPTGYFGIVDLSTVDVVNDSVAEYQRVTGQTPELGWFGYYVVLLSSDDSVTWFYTDTLEQARNDYFLELVEEFSEWMCEDDEECLVA